MSSQVQFVEPSFTPPEQQREIALHYLGLKKGTEGRLRPSH
ncbi:hypothetical protein [Corynebacterium diphtheriae]|nr:hypothetical protein [Corynebacterium diphtheriae]CAB0574843.1 hypothetical protein CIP107528_02278 [Corynebacterium diphtheriae]